MFEPDFFDKLENKLISSGSGVARHLGTDIPGTSLVANVFGGLIAAVSAYRIEPMLGYTFAGVMTAKTLFDMQKDTYANEVAQGNLTKSRFIDILAPKAKSNVTLSRFLFLTATASGYFAFEKDANAAIMCAGIATICYSRYIARKDSEQFLDPFDLS